MKQTNTNRTQTGTAANPSRLRVSPDRRYLVTETGTPFYLIGDTAWELFHRLNRDEALLYLTTRKEQGFNFIQAVVLAELDGLTEPNAHGRCPLLRGEDGQFDPAKPDLTGDYHYFDHVETVLTMAEELELYVGLLPTWGDKYNRKWGTGPEIFTPENARIYASWLAERFGHHPNLIWILGGDRPLENEHHYAVIDAMAQGLREHSDALITFHPCGACSSSAFVHGRDWLDFNMVQSGHSFPCRPDGYELIAADRAKEPVRPVMDGEQCYEDHAKSFDAKNGYFAAADIRVTMYRNLLSGSCGNTYGHSSVWCMNREPSAYQPNTWRTALHRPAAETVRYFAEFVKKHDLTAHCPTDCAVMNNAHDANYTAAMVGERSAYLYIPNGIPVILNPDAFPFRPSSLTVFFPADGTYSDTAAALDENGRITFPGRGAGHGMDAVLILTGGPQET